MANKIGFVFQGGGDHGIVSATFASLVMNEGFIPQVVSGTSAGILNAWTLGFLDVKHLMDLWFSIKGQKDIFESNWWVTLPWKTGYFKTGPLLKLIEGVIGDRQMPLIDCGGVVVDAFTRQKIICTPEARPSYFDASGAAHTLTVPETMVASCSIPVVAEAMKERFTDGGQRENAPLKFCIDQGCDLIFVFLNAPYPAIPRTAKSFAFPQIIGRGQAALEAILEENLMNDLARAERENRRIDMGERTPGMKGHKRLTIKVMAPPAEISSSMLDFDPADIRANYEAAKFRFEEYLRGGFFRGIETRGFTNARTITASLMKLSGAV